MARPEKRAVFLTMTQISYSSRFEVEPLLEVGDTKGYCILPSFTADAAEAEDLKRLLKLHVLTPVQTHSLNVKKVEKPEDIAENTDALITYSKGLSIGVFTADCVPILICAPDVEGIAAVHAGWKGTLGGIVENAINMLVKKGADPAKMIVAFGPSISSGHYEVDTDLARTFITAGFSEYVSYPNGIDREPHIDLQGINVRRMLDCGLLRENIKTHSGCTYSTRRDNGTFLYQSHRRSNGNPGRMLTCIVMN